MTIHRTYSLTISGPEEAVQDPGMETRMVNRILEGRVLRDAEDVLNDALPDDWHAKIREWDAEEVDEP